MIKYLTTALLALSPALAQAQSFSVPEGCDAVLTVQHKGCAMVNVWQCEADPAGDKWIALIGENGVFSVQHIDNEFQWLDSYKPSGTETLVQPAPDPASMTDLLRTGIDTWDFTIEKPNGAERNVGYDALSGVEVVIDDEPLLQTDFEGRIIGADGVEVDGGLGRQYVSVKHRLFFFGESWDADTPDDVLDMSPVEFIYPGEDGFFSDRPKFECGVIESAYMP